MLARLPVRFRRPEGQAARERYPTGRLTEVPHKNCDTIAQAGPGTRAPRWQEFRTHMPWDAEDLNRQRGQKRLAEATTGEGGLSVDDAGFAQQGKGAVGGARQ